MNTSTSEITKYPDRDSEKVCKCLSKAKNLRKELENIRTFEPSRCAIKFKEREHDASNMDPTFSLDLHGFRKNEGIRAVREFLSLMEDSGIRRFSIIYGLSKQTMFKVTKKILSNKNIEGDYREAEFYYDQGKKKVESKKFSLEIPITHRVLDLKFFTKEGVKTPHGKRLEARSFRIYRDYF